MQPTAQCALTHDAAVRHTKMCGQQRHGPGCGQVAVRARVLHEDLGQQCRIDLIGLARPARMRRIGLVLYAAMREVALHPTMHGAAVHRCPARRFGDGCALGHPEHRLQTSKQASRGGLRQCPS